jgi:hypothetical protein
MPWVAFDLGGMFEALQPRRKLRPVRKRAAAVGRCRLTLSDPR